MYNVVLIDTFLKSALLWPGADPENFSRGGGGFQPQIWKITNFYISSNISDIKLCKFQEPPPPKIRACMT